MLGNDSVGLVEAPATKFVGVFVTADRCGFSSCTKTPKTLHLRRADLREEFGFGDNLAFDSAASENRHKVEEE